MKKILIVLFLFVSERGSTQLKPVYIFQQDDTLLKRKYYLEALQKKNIIINALGKDNIKEYKESYDNMFDVVKDFLISPRSVTEHSADNYIKSVAAKIINVNPELKGLDIRIVFSRDIIPNAYSIGEGTIVFNAGLFVFLNSEAEMAFVLCHELAHYYLDHSKKKIDKIIRIANSDSLKKELKRLSKEEYKVGEQLEKLLKTLSFDIRRHSRDGEEEADRIGMLFFKNTGYNGNSFVTLMQLLDKIDDTTLFAPPNLQKVLSFPGYPFKERWIKKESVIFGAMNVEDVPGFTKKEKDSLKTHPDCSRRIALLADSASKINGRDFQVDKALFGKLKQDFIPEIVEEVYKSGNISFNLYLSLQMLQENKYADLAVFSIVRDLNLLFTHQKEHKLGLIIDSENRFFSEGYNTLLRMLYRLRLNEIADLNVQFCSFYQEQMKNYQDFEEEMIKAKTYQQSNNN
ncbi:MAG: M48 family metalloprotease [Sphingobacteriales bacterium]|nr:M48 family metalloprotease [Sphingobacteriales bacterium]